MTKASPARGAGKPLAVYDGKAFHVVFRGRSLAVAAEAGADGNINVELDGVTHWAPLPGESEPQDIAIEDLGVILDAIESAAEAAGLSRVVVDPRPEARSEDPSTGVRVVDLETNGVAQRRMPVSSPASGPSKPVRSSGHTGAPKAA